MPEPILSDYFYGDESEEFVFFKIPRQLITSPKFKHVSTDAKLLYGMLLDRMSLSARNGWYDDTGRVYIYYSVDEICGDMTCGRDKAMKLLAELDTKKGVGLIERVKQGQGKPTKIYVKRFTTRTIPEVPPSPGPEPFAPISEVGKADVQKSEIPTSRGRKNRLPDVGNSDPNYTKRNQKKIIQTDPSISPRDPPAVLGMDRYEQREEVKANIDYDHLRREHPFDDILAKVRPRIYGISMHKFDLSDKDMVIAITVPKSISRPHAVNDGNKDNFYIRHSNGVTNMSLDDLRREILSSASYQTEIKRFRQDRIAMIMSNEYIRNFEEGAKLVLHLIPLWSLDIGNAVDLNALDSWTSRNGFCPMSGGGYESIYCAEGRLSFSIPHNSNDVQSSMLVMRNGIIEVVDSRMMNYDRKHKEVYHWNELERIIYKKINDCGTLLEKLNAPRPWYISAAIVNGKEYRTSDAWNGQSECLHSNYIQSVDCLWNDEQSLNEIIQPCFDALANAFGYRKSGIDFASDKIK